MDWGLLNMWSSFIFVLLFVYRATAKSVIVPIVALNDGHKVPSIGFGTWLGSGIHSSVEKEKMEEAVMWAIDVGYRHIDTAKMFGVEANVGRAIANRIEADVLTREDLFVSSKLWNNAHKRYSVVPALKASLKKMGLDYVDLFVIHWPMAADNKGNWDTSIDYTETWKGMQEARKLNLTRSIGLANFNESQIERILSLGGVKPSVLQTEVNLNIQSPELLAFAKSHNLKVMAYSPFGSLYHERIAGGRAPRPRCDSPELNKMAQSYNKTVAQLVLRYLHELDVIPLPRSVTRHRIEENIDIFDFRLKESDKEKLKSYDRNYRTFNSAGYRKSAEYPYVDAKKTSSTKDKSSRNSTISRKNHNDKENVTLMNPFSVSKNQEKMEESRTSIIKEKYNKTNYNNTKQNTITTKVILVPNSLDRMTENTTLIISDKNEVDTANQHPENITAMKPVSVSGDLKTSTEHQHAAAVIDNNVVNNTVMKPIVVSNSINNQKEKIKIKNSTLPKIIKYHKKEEIAEANNTVKQPEQSDGKAKYFL